MAEEREPVSLPVNPRYRELYRGQSDRDRRRALAAQMSPRYLAAMLDIELGFGGC
jgi:hypothetical protein